MLQTILSKCKFLNSGIYIPPELDLDIYEVYDFIHQAVTDNHIPVTKAIGFKITSSKTLRAKVSAVERNAAVLENLVSVSTNLSDKIFRETTSDKIVADIDGKFDLEDEECYFTESMKKLPVMYTRSYILTSIFPSTLEIILDTGTGYHNMEKNVKKIEDNNFFPMISVHSLNDFVRVCPPSKEDFIELRFDNSFDIELFRKYLLGLYSKFSGRSLERRDLEWLSDYVI